MAGPPGDAQPAERALEALAERGRCQRAAQLDLVGERGRDDLDIARRKRGEGVQGCTDLVALPYRRRNGSLGDVVEAVLGASTRPAPDGARGPGRVGQGPDQGVAFAVVVFEVSEQRDECVLRDVLT